MESEYWDHIQIISIRHEIMVLPLIITGNDRSRLNKWLLQYIRGEKDEKGYDRINDIHVNTDRSYIWNARKIRRST